MRKITILFFATVFLACNNQDNADVVAEDTLTDADTLLLPEERQLWVTDYDTNTGEFFLKQQRKADAKTLSPEGVISDINAVWENIKLVYRKISNDTLYVEIPESEFLTNQMGSSGPAAYLAATTYSLTELKGVRFVNYSFEEGEHLSPGVFRREDFKNFK